MRRLQPIILTTIAVLTMAASGVAGLSATTSHVPLSDLGDDSDGSGWKKCGAWCNGTWFTVGSCLNSQACCGWVNCAAGSGQIACCNPGTTCKDGLDSDPPGMPRCDPQT